jgi:acylphosphatase
VRSRSLQLVAVRRVRVVVGGRVQGVWFRQSTVEVAERHGATGWVRNRADGTVEAEVQGPPAAVDAVVAHCRIGPPLAVVTTVHVSELPPVDGETGFDGW